MANFGAEPKCALSPFMSRVAIATRTTPGAGALRLRVSSSVLTSCRRRTAVMIALPIEERVQGFGRRLAAGALENIGGLENEIARALVADAQFVLAAEPVEDREADPHQRDAEPVRRLPAVAVGDEQVGALGHGLEVAEVAELHAVAGDVL